MKQTITPAERLQLTGLVALAEAYTRKLDDILTVGVELLGAKGNDQLARDHLADALWNGEDLDELLDQLGITVVDEAIVEEVQP